MIRVPFLGRRLSEGTLEQKKGKRGPTRLPRVYYDSPIWAPVTVYYRGLNNLNKFIFIFLVGGGGVFIV